MPAELGRIDLGDVTPHNIKLLRKVNTVVFPVSYHDKFYKVIKQYLLTVFSKCLSRMCLNLVSWRSWRTSTTLWLGRSVVEWTCKAPAGRFLQRIQFTWIFLDQTSKTSLIWNCQLQLYIMTLGCLAPYRRLGIGTRMLEHVLNIVKEDGNYTSIFLHVQV